MTKKDYERFAEAFRIVRREYKGILEDSKDAERIFGAILVKVTNIFKADNAKFDDDRFWEAVYPPRYVTVGGHPPKKITI